MKQGLQLLGLAAEAMNHPRSTGTQLLVQGNDRVESFHTMQYHGHIPGYGPFGLHAEDFFLQGYRMTAVRIQTAFAHK